MDTTSLFNDEERQYLNKLTENQLKSEIKHDDILTVIRFSKATADKNDTEFLGLIDGVYEKISLLSDNEWDKTARLMPFLVNISYDELSSEDDFS